MKRDGPKAPTAVHGPLEITYHLNKKANMIVDCLENQFTSHNLCDKTMSDRWRPEPKLCSHLQTTPHWEKLRPCDIHKLANLLKLRKACGPNGIANECLQHLPRRPLVRLSHLFNHCLQLYHFSKPWKETKVITLSKPSKNPKFPKNLCLISLLSTTGNLFKKAILKIVQRHIHERGLLNASQFCFHARHCMTLKCMRLTNHVTLNFNNNVSTAAVFFGTEKAFDTTWHLGFVYKLSESKFSISLIKLISSFLSQRKFRVSVESKMPRYIQAGMPRGSVLSPTLYSIYIL
jgi:hypothetical protein